MVDALSIQETSDGKQILFSTQQDFFFEAVLWRTGGLLLSALLRAPQDLSVLSKLPDYRECGGNEHQHRSKVRCGARGTRTDRHRVDIHHHKRWPQAQRYSALHHPTDQKRSGPLQPTTASTAGGNSGTNACPKKLEKHKQDLS